MENINLEKLKELGKLDDAFELYRASDVRDLEDLCKKVKDGQITVPIFEQKPKWTVQEAINTFNYLLTNDFFTLPFAFDVITNEPKVKQLSFPDYKPIDSNYKYNNTFSIIAGSKILDMYYKAYIGDDIFKNVVFDLSIGKIRFYQHYSPEFNKVFSINFILTAKPKDYYQEYCKLFGVEDTDDIDDDEDEFFDMRHYLYQFRDCFFPNCFASVATDLSKKEQLRWRRQLHLALR